MFTQTFVMGILFGILTWAVPNPTMRDGASRHVNASQRHAADFANLFQNISAPLLLDAWEAPNCPGESDAQTDFTFAHPFIGQNMSNIIIARSFRLNRTLDNQEQFDISVASNSAAWHPDKYEYSHNGSSCTNFLQSYYAINGSTSCHNTPPFTCHRLWNNLGLQAT